MNDMERFVEAQESCYEKVLGELRAGQKMTHWMWFIFPQLRGLGRSSTAHQFGIEDLVEAQQYLRHEVLGPRLIDCAKLAIAVPNKTAVGIFGATDARKLKSCVTLFGAADPSIDVFPGALARFYDDRPDRRTLSMLGLDWPHQAKDHGTPSP